MQVVGGDADKDVAVLQLDMPREKMEQLKPIALGTSTNLLVGQKVPEMLDRWGAFLSLEASLQAVAACPTIWFHALVLMVFSR